MMLFSSGARQETLERFDTLDFDGVETIHVEGPGSEVIVAAGSGGAHSASVEASGWSARWCATRVDVQRSGPDLRIRVDRGALAPPFGCDLTLRLAVPDGIGVSIRQAATVARFSGVFGALTVESPKAVVDFTGIARSVSVDSQDAVVELAYAGDEARTSTTAITAEKLVAHVGLPAGIPVSWTVEAPVSVFTSDHPNVAGAAARVEIRSRLLKGSLYRLAGAS